MKLLLDTHVLLWWMLDEAKRHLSHEQVALLERAEKHGVFVSAITFWEIAKLVELKRISLRTPVEVIFQDLEADPGVEILPLTPSIALESTRLALHRDPADQIIVATARVHDLRLVTVDDRIRSSGLANVA